MISETLGERCLIFLKSLFSLGSSHLAHIFHFAIAHALSFVAKQRTKLIKA